MHAFCNFLSYNVVLFSNTLGVTIQTKQISSRVGIIPSYLNDYMPNQKHLPFQSIFLKHAKSQQSPTSENIIQIIFSSRLTDNDKILNFPCYCATLTVLKQEFRKRE